jgi:tripartite-type tricarboxylate transporter receptor subunit TctC
MSTILRALACALLALGSVHARAAESQYPSKAIRIVVPFAPGGLTDVLGRAIGERLRAAWGQPVVIDNRTGADGIVGAQVALNAVPDGYTLLMIGISFAANPSVHRKMPYDTLREFAPLVLLADAPMVLAVHPQLKVDALPQLLTLARTKPGQLNYASGGNGSSQHLAAVLFEITGKIDLNHVPFRGAAPALLDLVAGRVDLMFAPLAQSSTHAKAGRLKLLGVTSAQRVSLDPALPTIAEAGVPGYEARAWFGLAVQSAVPRDVMAKLNRKISDEVRDTAFAEKLAAMGMVPGGGSSEEFAAFVKREMSKYAAVVKKAGLQID